MTRSEALQQITAALEACGALDDSTALDEDVDLIESGIIDSLDAMMFLFELEKALGHKVSTIDETYEGFKIGELIDAVVADAQSRGA